MNDQAVDRCHRIGQAKPVTVYVLVAADTVDETIYKRAAGKKEKSESLLDKGDGAEDDGAGLDGSGRRCGWRGVSSAAENMPIATGAIWSKGFFATSCCGNCSVPSCRVIPNPTRPLRSASSRISWRRVMR